MSQVLPPSGLLTSWKEIATYMGKGVRTVQRWEATMGLPVIRPGDGRPGTVMARPGDLDAWVLGKWNKSHNDHSRRAPANEDAVTRANLTACLTELRSYHKTVKSLCDEMQSARQTLKEEVERLRRLYTEWHAIRVNAVGDSYSPAAHNDSKVH